MRSVNISIHLLNGNSASVAINKFQLVSLALSNEEAIQLESRIRNKTSTENNEAIAIFKSREANKFRVVISLDKFKIPTLTHKQMLIITTFLNETHCPPKNIWDECMDENLTFQKQWEVAKDKDHLFLAGPSCTYQNQNGVTGTCIKNWLLNDFESKYMFSEQFIKNFQHSLITEDHKYASYHMLQLDSFVCGDLLKIATAHHEKKLQPQVSAIVITAFRHKALPLEINSHIGFFLPSNDARYLAMTNNASATIGVALQYAEKSLNKIPRHIRHGFLSRIIRASIL